MELVEKNGTNLKTKIATLIFMDLETTGLPFEVGKRNVHITEISLVAVDRNSFEEDKSLRILNKLSLCISPRSVVSPGAMQITGLYNDILEKQKEFDESVPKLLEYFFRRLQPPVCLLAHNGNRFDFPVLQAELKRIKYSLGPHVLCADTLEAFRSICRLAKLDETLNAEKITEMEENNSGHVKSEGDNLSEKDFDKLLTDDMDTFVKLENSLPSKAETCSSLEDIFETSQFEQEVINTNFQIKPAENKCLPDDILPQVLNEKTPVKSTNSFDFNELAKRKPTKRRILDPTFNPKTFDQKKKAPASNIPPLVKRSLFSEPESSTPELSKITKFSLEHLYKLFFNENPPQSHYAEIDCITLSKICQKIDEKFLKWIDENSLAFCNVDALW